MLTIAPIVFSHHRRKDGTYNVKIRVTWKGVNKYIATNLWCSKDDLTRSLKIKTPAIVDAAARLCAVEDIIHQRTIDCRFPVGWRCWIYNLLPKYI